MVLWDPTRIVERKMECQNKGDQKKEQEEREREKRELGRDPTTTLTAASSRVKL